MGSNKNIQRAGNSFIDKLCKLRGTWIFLNIHSTKDWGHEEKWPFKEESPFEEGRDG